MLKKWLFLYLLCLPGLLILVSCDMPGSAPTPLPANTPEAVTFPALQAGGHAQVVYFQPYLLDKSSYLNGKVMLNGELMRYDPTTRHTSTLLQLSNVKIEEAQISADGAWILYVAYVQDHDELRVVRSDGADAQILLSAPLYAGLSNALWSPDQKSILFAEQPPQEGPTSIYLLNLAQNHLQLAFTSASKVGAPQYVPRKWLDNTRALVTDANVSYDTQNATFHQLALLDTGKGANQRPGDLQILASGNGECTDFDTSPDATQLFLLNCHRGTYPDTSVESTLSVLPLNGGSPRVIFHSTSLWINQVRWLAPQTLFLLGDKVVGRLQSDGTGGLQQLFSPGPRQVLSFSRFTRLPWSNLARAGNLYALESIEVGTDTHGSELVVGSLDGGVPQVVGQAGVGMGEIFQGADIYLAGWITL
jgi:hypothetical protein